MFKHFTLATTLFISTLVQADELYPVDESRYLIDFSAKVLPFIRSAKNSGRFAGVNGVSISYQTFVHPQEKAKLVISSGFSEVWLKYRETIYDFYRFGYSVYILDHRGQGESERLVKPEDIPGSSSTARQIVHVDDFDHYARDLKTFIDTVVLRNNPNGKAFLLGQSMGGMIAVRYSLLYQNEGKISRMALLAPMITPQFPYPETAVKLLTSVGNAKEYAMGQGDHNLTFDPNARHSTEDFQRDFAANTCTNSVPRHQSKLQMFYDYPQFVMGGASNGWVKAALEVSQKTRDLGSNLRIPTLLLQAGIETYVRNDAQANFCKRPVCRIGVDPRARHELYNETSATRDHVLLRVHDFFRETSRP